MQSIYLYINGSNILKDHAYAQVDFSNSHCLCFKVEVETPRVSGRIPMVRVRNPWGDSHEWKGPWSDEWVVIWSCVQNMLFISWFCSWCCWLRFVRDPFFFQIVDISAWFPALKSGLWYQMMRKNSWVWPTAMMENSGGLYCKTRQSEHGLSVNKVSSLWAACCSQDVFQGLGQRVPALGDSVPGPRYSPGGGWGWRVGTSA